MNWASNTEGKPFPSWLTRGILVGIWFSLFSWGLAGMAQRRTLEDELVNRSRELHAMRVRGTVELEALEGFSQRLHALVSDDPENGDATPLSGIEVSAAIQSFVHTYRNRLSDVGIELQQLDLGFADAFGEMTLVSAEPELRVMKEQLKLAGEVLDLAIQVSPIAISALSREAQVDEGQAKALLRLQFEMHGYTRCLRDWLKLNLDREPNQQLRVVSIRVSRSPLSEADRSLEWFGDGSIHSPVSRSVTSVQESPFGRYLNQSHLQSASKESEPMPLIGKGVSCFQMVVERRAVW